MAAEIATPQTDQQKKNLELIRHWEDTYNNAPVEKFITETYAPDANVVFTGASVHGYEQFIRLEKAIKEAAPGRTMRIDRLLFFGDTDVIIEAVVLDSAQPNYFSPWAAILTIRDGKIIQDHTFLEPARWPGIAATTGIATLGGLGAPAPAR